MGRENVGWIETIQNNVQCKRFVNAIRNIGFNEGKEIRDQLDNHNHNLLKKSRLFA
jgi:hypothetical protein